MPPISMCAKIVILDDEPDRIVEMTRCVERCDSSCELVIFDNAPDMIAWFADHLESAHLACLDHDLGPTRMRDDAAFDPGTGRDVADYLAGRAPVCPVLIHTTNTLAAPGMIMTLETAGWQCARVSPYSDLDWVAEVWIGEVVRLIDYRRTAASSRPQGPPSANHPDG